MYKNELPVIVDVLKNGGSILYPSDTIWGLGCDATNYNAVEEIVKIKNREVNQKFILLALNIEMIKQFVEYVPSEIENFLEKQSKPCTIIYPNSKNLPGNVVAEDNSIAFRIPKDDFCLRLISKFGKPIVSTSANFHGEKSPIDFIDIDKELVKRVKYIVKYKQNATNAGITSSIYRWHEKKQEFNRLR